jgi:hypothetical protein
MVKAAMETDRPMPTIIGQGGRRLVLGVVWIVAFSAALIATAD